MFSSRRVLPQPHLLATSQSLSEAVQLASEDLSRSQVGAAAPDRRSAKIPQPLSRLVSPSRGLVPPARLDPDDAISPRTRQA